MRPRLLICGFLFIFLIVSALGVHAANRFAVVSGSWNGSIWATTAGGSPGASVPGSGDQVTINAGVTVNITAAANAAALTVSGTLNFNSGADLTMANGANVSIMSGAVVIFDANGQLVGGGTSGTTGVAVKINSGATLITANAIGFMAGVNSTAITGSIAINRGTRVGPVYNTGVDYVYNSASAQNIGTGPTTMADLTVSNTGIVSASGNLTVSGILSIGNNAQLSLNSRTLTLSGAGTALSMSSTGTLDPGTSTVVYSGTSAQTITGTTYNNLTFSGSGTKSFPAGSDASIAGNWVTGTAGVTLTGDANVSVTGSISGSAQITMGSGMLSLGGTTTGAFGNTGTFNSGSGTVIYNRSGAQTLKLTTYNNLILSGTGTNVKTISGTLTVNGTLTMEGTASIGTTAPVYGSAAALVYSSTATRNVGLEWPAQMTPTGGVTVGGTAAVSLNANKLLQTGVPLTINSGATLTTGNFDIVLRDDFVNNGTWTSSTGDVTVTGTAGQFIGPFSTTGLFISTKTGGGVATLTGNIKAGSMTINGSTSTVNLGSGLTHEVVGTVTLTAGSLNGGTSTLLVGGTWAGTGTLFQANNSTVNFYRAAQTLSATGAKTFYNLIYSGGGNKTTSAGTTVVNNILSLEDIAAPAGTFPTYGANATLRYNTATARTAGGEWLATFTASGGVVIDNTGKITLAANKVFGANAPFTIENGATFDAGAFDMSFSNDFIINGTGVWTANSGDVAVQGTGAQSIAGFTTTGLFSMLKTGGTATLQGDVNSNGFVLNGTGGTLDLGTGRTHTFNGTYTNTAGTVNANNSTMNLGAAVASSGGAFNPQTGTVNFTANVPQAVPAVTWYNLGFSGTGLKTMTGVAGATTMTIEPGATVDMGAFTFTISGAGTPLVINGNGALIPSTSVIGFTNAGSVTIPAIDYYSLYGSTGGPRILSSTGTIRIAGVFTPGTTNYDVTGSTVDFNGSGDQPIPAFTFNKLIVSNNGIKKIQASIVVACQSIDINDNASVEVHTDALGRLNVTGP